MTEQPDMPPAATTAGRGMRIALIASLGANLVVAGLFAGAWMQGPGGGHMEMDDSGGFRGLAWAMPHETRRELGREIFSRRDEYRTKRDQISAARVNLADALTADPFDIAAVEAVFAEQKLLLSGLADEGYRTLTAAITGMTRDQRAEFAENLRRH